MSPQDIANFMACIAETPEFQFLRKLMEEDKAFAGDEEPGDDEGLGLPDEGDTELADDSDPDDDQGDGIVPIDDEQSNSPPQQADKPQGKEKFTMPASDVVSVEKYTDLQKSHEGLIEKYTALHGQVQQMQKITADATRKQKIGELAAKYPLVVDVAEEEKACLYSLGSSMTEEECSKHFATIEKYGEKFANSPMIPRGQLPERYTTREQGDVEKYNQRLSDEAIKYHAEQQAAGKHPTWSECEAEASKRIKNSGQAAAAA